MNPNSIAEWQGVLRDTLILGLATFIIVFEIGFKDSPNAYALGTALTLFGVPPALRLDQVRRQKRRSPSRTRPSTDAPNGDDIYDGPGGYYKAGEE